MEKCNARFEFFYCYEKRSLAVKCSLVWFQTHTHIHAFTGIDCIVNELTVIFSCFIFPSYCSQEVRYQIIPPDLSPPPTRVPGPFLNLKLLCLLSVTTTHFLLWVPFLPTRG